MSKGILQSILTRKLSLELVYREPETIDENEDIGPAENEKDGHQSDHIFARPARRLALGSRFATAVETDGPPRESCSLKESGKIFRKYSDAEKCDG
jgi:hypothetical protein